EVQRADVLPRGLHRHDLLGRLRRRHEYDVQAIHPSVHAMLLGLCKGETSSKVLPSCNRDIITHFIGCANPLSCPYAATVAGAGRPVPARAGDTATVAPVSRRRPCRAAPCRRRALAAPRRPPASSP